MPPKGNQGRFLATLLGADSETALRWFVMVVAPAGVLLLLAATSATPVDLRIFGRRGVPSGGWLLPDADGGVGS